MSDSLLPLSEAAERLGVHTSTLRRWADRGEIRVVTTPGGHRRFPESEVERLAGGSSDEPPKTGLQEIALSHTREEISHTDANWKQLSAAELEEKRMLGRRLLGLMMQYVSAADGEGDEALVEARAIGRIHARSAHRSGMPLSETMRATLFFRDNILESAILLPESGSANPQNRNRLFRRVNRFLNEIELSIAEVYESAAH